MSLPAYRTISAKRSDIQFDRILIFSFMFHSDVFPLHIDTILIKLSFLYSKGSHVETSIIVMHIEMHIVILIIFYFFAFL